MRRSDRVTSCGATTSVVLGLALSPVLCVGLACGDDLPTNMGATGTGSTAGEVGTTAIDPDPSTGPVADDTASSSTTAPPSAVPEYARGIRLTRMTANQGVQVTLVDDGQEVDPADYNTRLITGRRTLLRAFWSLHADFTPREIIGRLVAIYPDGTELTQDRVELIDGESTDGGKSFQWLLEADQVVPGIQYRVRLLEADPDLATGEVSEPPPVLPLAGAGTMGFYDATLQLRVVLIPVLHTFEYEGRSDCMAEITDEDVEAMQQDLEQNNAVQQTLFEVGDPMPYSDPIGTSGMGFSPILSALAMRRAADDPPPNVYYYGLIQPCDGYPGGLLGQAIGIPPEPTMELASQRIATGRWNGSGAAAAETFTHEIGHSQGRRHVTCSGGEGGPESDYPHPNGRIGVWGFGIHDFQLRSPSAARDYMTYCSNEWVSDYGWEKTLDVIETLTSWDAADVSPRATGDGLLLGALYDDGSSDWWTDRGALDPSLATPGAALVVRDVDGERALPAWIYPRPDDEDTLQVIAPRPARLADAWALELVQPDRMVPTAVSLAAIRDLAAGHLTTP